MPVKDFPQPMTGRFLSGLQEPRARAYHSMHNHYCKQFLTDRHTMIHDRSFLATSRATMMFPTRRKHGTGTTHTTRQAVHKGALHMTSTLSSPCNSGFRAIFVASPLFRCYLLSADFVNRSQHDDCIRISPPTNESQDQLS